jgi:hypothetical protein
MSDVQQCECHCMLEFGFLVDVVIENYPVFVIVIVSEQWQVTDFLYFYCLDWLIGELV